MEQKLDLRVIKTYHALTEALKDLLSKKPLNEITVNEICERAVIRRTTFYKHFRDKYGLLLFVAKEIQEEIDKKALEMRNSDDGAHQDFYYNILCLFEYLEIHQELYRSLQSSFSSSFVWESLSNETAKNVKAYMAKSAGGDKLSPAYMELTSQFLIGSLYQGMGWWLNHMDQFSKTEMADQLCSFVTNAVGQI
ncbi:MAG: TetR/AcrR family transcriptional regulator [Clostridiales bacterium]|nr:TetR/AcrR family transcriptional regulator [Clostridiales bacterium]